METNIDSLNTNNTTAQVERPDFLKIICILSFVATGLMILIYSLGSITLAMSQSTIEEIWPQVIQSNPQFEDVDGIEFFHSVGLYCVYALIANIFSLIGVIMMWRMEKMGFYIYVVAELVTNFFSLNINTGEASPSYFGLIFSILLDLVFIVMYFMNLKHMNKKQSIR